MFRPRLWTAGFISQRAALYPFDQFDRRWFLSDWEIEGRLGRVNEDAAVALLDNKLLFHVVVAAGVGRNSLPTLVGLMIDERFQPLGPFATPAAAISALGAVVVKPVSGWGGNQVSIVRTDSELDRHRGHFIIEGHVDQHPYAAAIFPGSLNTLRVVTMTDADGLPFIAAAVHRFGCAGSIPVDNFKRGGIAALIDLDTGQLSTGRSNPGVHRTSTHSVHPDTGVSIEGVVVPRWHDLKALAIELATLYPGLHHVGWDLCLTANGPCVIEGNGRLPNPNLIQAHTPLLQDARVRDFMVRHGVLSPARARRLATAQSAAS